MSLRCCIVPVIPHWYRPAGERHTALPARSRAVIRGFSALADVSFHPFLSTASFRSRPTVKWSGLPLQRRPYSLYTCLTLGPHPCMFLLLSVCLYVCIRAHMCVQICARVVSFLCVVFHCSVSRFLLLSGSCSLSLCSTTVYSSGLVWSAGLVWSSPDSPRLVRTRLDSSRLLAAFRAPGRSADSSLTVWLPGNAPLPVAVDERG